MGKIIIDTNIWIYAAKYKIDLFSEFLGEEIFVTKSIINELENIMKKNSENKLYAKIALDLIKNKNVKILDEEGYTDDLLIKLGKEGYKIATEDSELIERLKKEGIKGYFLRQKKYFTSF